MDVDMDMNTDVNVNIPGDDDDDGNRAGVSSRRTSILPSARGERRRNPSSSPRRLPPLFDSSPYDPIS